MVTNEKLVSSSDAVVKHFIGKTSLWFLRVYFCIVHIIISIATPLTKIYTKVKKAIDDVIDCCEPHFKIFNNQRGEMRPRKLSIHRLLVLCSKHSALNFRWMFALHFALLINVVNVNFVKSHERNTSGDSCLALNRLVVLKCDSRRRLLCLTRLEVYRLASPIDESRYIHRL